MQFVLLPTAKFPSIGVVPLEFFFFNTFPPAVYESDGFSIECTDKLFNFC